MPVVALAQKPLELAEELRAWGPRETEPHQAGRAFVAIPKAVSVSAESIEQCENAAYFVVWDKAEKESEGPSAEGHGKCPRPRYRERKTDTKPHTE